VEEIFLIVLNYFPHHLNKVSHSCDFHRSTPDRPIQWAMKRVQGERWLGMEGIEEKGYGNHLISFP